MKNTQKGSVLSIVVGVIAVLVIAVVVFASPKASAPTVVPTIPTDTTTPPPTTPIVSPAQPTKPVTTTTPTKPTNPTQAPLILLPTIETITPTTGSTGTMVTLTGSGFLSANTVLFGGGPVTNAVATKGGTVLTFSVPSSVGADCKPNQACPMYARLITNGMYTVAVRTANGTSNTVSYVVTGGTSINPQ